MKTSISKEKFACQPVVVDYMDMQFLNFANEYLRENEKFRETVFAVHMVPRWSFLKKKVLIISWHCPFKQRDSKRSFENSYYED